MLRGTKSEEGTMPHRSILFFLLIAAMIATASISLSEPVTAKDMTLLAVAGEGDSMTGSGAELNLIITRGTGRVFMETVPFTKLDTQMSTHFAKEVACNYLDIDCSRYDFFYTIKSNSAIIGGPSAGAAITFLTIAKLRHETIPQDFSVTGTINLGGTIGRVGGVKEKILAASGLGLKTVYIPKGDRYYSSGDDLLINMTEEGDITGISKNSSAVGNRIDLVEFGKEHNINVVEVSTIDDLMCNVMGRNCINTSEEAQANEAYNLTMLGIAISICNRTNSLVAKINDSIIDYDLRNNIINLSIKDLDMKSLLELMTRRNHAFRFGRYYSMASFCFSANMMLQEYSKQKIDEKTYEEEMTRLKSSMGFFREQLAKKRISTITDLQTYIIVKERLDETEDYLDLIREIDRISERVHNGSATRKEIESYNATEAFQQKKSILAYGTERFYSASMWSDFFGKDPLQFVMNNDILRESCMNKIYEAQERVEYMRLYFPALITTSQKSIALATKEYESGDYAFCLFKASKAKAQIDAMISSFSISNDTIDDVLIDKKNVASRMIRKEQDKGIFPILGFSYFEYAQSLSTSDKLQDKISALLYYDYAIEFSNLDVYFKKKDSGNGIMFLDVEYFKATFTYTMVLLSGIIVGIFIGIGIWVRRARIIRARDPGQKAHNDSIQDRKRATVSGKKRSQKKGRR